MAVTSDVNIYWREYGHLTNKNEGKNIEREGGHVY